MRSLILVLIAGLAPALLPAQEPRLARLPDQARVRVDSLVGAARVLGLPVEPLVDRALEGAAKGAPADRIVAAVIRLRDELSAVRQVWGEAVSTAELTAGASALRAGAAPNDLARLRRVRSNQPLTVAAAVLADLVAAGVPPDTAVRAVLALAPAADADYVAFRRNVQRDIELGASPSAALGVRLRAVQETLDAGAGPGTGTGSHAGERRKLKP